ncbi:MAG TPA: phosphoenolpyruvate carboxykinase (ATP) [Gammaproteobacteria bacterium]|nr:phosphoenolpyruvate carboxykinase (ATP) [Gammaproteobacteria bacterium]
MSKTPENSQYRIPPGTKLIIVDAHDTIFKPYLSRTQADIFDDPMKKERITWMLRYGFLNFVEYFAVQKKIDIVISSDGQKRRLTGIARQFGVYDKLKAIYGAEHIDKWDYLKRLDKILEQCQVEARDAVFIGDSQVDRFSAEKYGVRFIQVPNTVSERTFSFNAFLDINFDRGDYGLELIDLHGIKQVSHNLSTPQLVEEIIRRREGVLAHLGPVVINEFEFQSADDVRVYLVREPSSENDIHWSDVVSPVEMESYHRIFDSLKNFLEDQSVYIQDCYAGSEASCRIPLRIITRNAWPNLFARHMFRHVSNEEMESFFPEYTLIHIPEFKVGSDGDEDIADHLILINLLKKLILIVGANSSNTIRKAVFFTLSFILPKNDMIPVRCSAIKGNDGSLSIFFGRDHGLKNTLCLNTNHAFFGDDCHGWTQHDFTNIEWGCRTPVDGLDEIQDPEIYAATRKFATILENTGINAKRRVVLERKNPQYHAIASFPIAHFQRVDRSGVSAFPKHIFIIIKDSMGVLPALGKLTREQAAVFLLLGYESRWNLSQQEEWPTISYYPFYNSDLSFYRESFYTGLLYEKLEHAQSECWLLNAIPVGPRKHDSALVNLTLLRRFVSAIQGDAMHQIEWHADRYWKFQSVCKFAGYPQAVLDPETAWEGEPERFLASNHLLKRAFSDRLSKYKDDLSPNLQDVIAWLVS